MRARTCVTNPRLVPLVRVMTDLETSCERESSTPASPSSLSASATPRRAQSRALRLRRTKPASVVPSAARSRAMRAHGASAVRRPAGIGRTGCRPARVCAQLRRAVRTAGVSAILEATMAPGARVFPFSADIRYIVRCTFGSQHTRSAAATGARAGRRHGAPHGRRRPRAQRGHGWRRVDGAQRSHPPARGECFPAGRRGARRTAACCCMFCGAACASQSTPILRRTLLEVPYT